MTDQEVLQTAINKACDNGYSAKFSEHHALELYMSFHKYYVIIFDHDFAKAFWSEDLVDRKMRPWKEAPTNTAIRKRKNQSFEDAYEDRVLLCWKMHLQQMILEPNPIDYLRKFIKE